MNNEETPNYDDIRQIASKNWLSAASVSLAKLDEVKAKVYNIGLSNAKNLKPTPRGVGQVTQQNNGDGKNTRWGSTAPPLSGISMQKNAWNTVLTVPEKATNIKSECQKQLFRSRPESAKLSHTNKNQTSARLKRRPQSANLYVSARQEKEEDLVLEDDVDEEVNSVLGVQGAKFNQSERPENFSVHIASTGYVAPSQNENYHLSTPDTIETTQTEAFIHIPGSGDRGALTAPRSSPEMSDVPESQINLNVYYPDDVIKDDNDQYSNCPLPTPKLIHLTMPNPNESYDPDDDCSPEIHIDIQHKPKTSSVKRKSFLEHPVPTQIEFESQTVPELNDAKPDFTTVSEELNKEVLNLKTNASLNPHTADLLSNKVTRRHSRPKSAKNTVQFDEKSNITVDITPRNVNVVEEPGDDCEVVVTQKPRPYSGRRDLRYVKSKTDSGFSNLRRVNSDQNLNSSSRPNMKKRPQSAKIATLTVSYIDDNGPINGSDDEKHKSNAKDKFQSKSKREMETLMSKMGLSDYHNQSKSTHMEKQSVGENYCEEDLEERPPSRPGSPTKSFSSSEKNYYEVAMTAPMRKSVQGLDFENNDLNKSFDGGAMGKEVKKTVKTLELMDGRELKEMKLVSVIGTQEHRSNDYVAPRPPSAAKSRPTSAIRPQSAVTKKTNRQPGDNKEKTQSFQRLQTRNGEKAITVNKTHNVEEKEINHSVPYTVETKLEPENSIDNDTNFIQCHVNEENETLDQLEIELREQQERLWKELESDGLIDIFPEVEDIRERPVSRMGFRADEVTREGQVPKTDDSTMVNKAKTNQEDIVISGVSSTCDEKPPVGLKKRRVNSAPFSRTTNTQRSPVNHRETTTHTTAVKIRPLSAHLSTEKENCKCSHTSHINNNMSQNKINKPTREGSITDIFAKANNFKGYANLTTNKLDYTTKKDKQQDWQSLDVVEIYTRKDDYQVETDGTKECRELQDKLLDNGVPVTLKALERALLPPTEYSWTGPSYKSNVTPNHPAFPSTAGLLTKPETWLPKEYKKVKEAKERVKLATEILEQQAMEEREKTNRRKQSGKKGKSKKKKSK